MIAGAVPEAFRPTLPKPQIPWTPEESERQFLYLLIGLIDNATGGLTWQLRDDIGMNDGIDTTSWGYRAGGWLAQGVGLLMNFAGGSGLLAEGMLSQPRLSPKGLPQLCQAA